MREILFPAQGLSLHLHLCICSTGTGRNPKLPQWQFPRSRTRWWRGPLWRRKRLLWVEAGGAGQPLPRWPSRTGSGGGEGRALRGLGLCLSRSAKLAKQPPARSRSTHRAQFEKTAGGRRTRLRCCGGGVRWPGVKKWKQASLWQLVTATTPSPSSYLGGGDSPRFGDGVREAWSRSQDWEVGGQLRLPGGGRPGGQPPGQELQTKGLQVTTQKL